MTPRTSVDDHPPTPLLVTVAEAADLLGIGRSKPYELITADVIRTVHIGRARRVPIASLVEFVDRLVGSEPATSHRIATLRITSPSTTNNRRAK